MQSKEIVSSQTLARIRTHRPRPGKSEPARPLAQSACTACNPSDNLASVGEEGGDAEDPDEGGGGGRRGVVNHREELTVEADYVDEGVVLE